jgi:hypothetical protein
LGLDMTLYRVGKDVSLPSFRSGMTSEEESRYYEEQDRIWNQMEEVAYWRKFNALHAWFVEECQDGVDECQLSLVDQYALEELINGLKSSLVTKKPYLEPRSGFFFGSTDIDDYYWESVKETIQTLSDIRSDTNFETHKLIYSSSW